MASNKKQSQHTKPNKNASTTTTTDPKNPSSTLPNFRWRSHFKLHSTHRRETLFFAGKFPRRNTLLRYFLLLSMLYVSGLILCLGPLSAILHPPPLPGSLYLSHQIFENLWNEIQSDNSSAIQVCFIIYIFPYIHDILLSGS